MAIHGGAGVILRENLSPEKETAYIHALTETVRTAYAALENGASALDAVELAVKLMEDSPLFNAGRGSVYNAEGKHEMDAAIMSGSDLSAGAVALVNRVKNPVSLARAVMEKSNHVFLAGAGAEEFAVKAGIELANKDYFHDEFRFQQWQKINGTNAAKLDHDVSLNEKKFGTVGAVALDTSGNLAAATSTGGMTNKLQGRIGDSPLIGAGTYANNQTCAVSCTGHGELFIKHVVAYDVHCLMYYKGMSLAEACNYVVNQKLTEAKAEGGLIAVDRFGNVALYFNTPGMYRAMKTPSEEYTAIFK
ncbi:MAG: isoaspartyl peptidase/L-asparaginase [Chitinophagales bacterium]|nr:isoaspartyl peptidase/L-asparaginase [Chitinophagales bacterium]